ncbi:MAG TPA: phosphoglucosamine mutase, partial [Chromatiales bacterium]|nr:phosphoglucosamine mutase [Chromatiales bacterium]
RGMDKLPQHMVNVPLETGDRTVVEADPVRDAVREAEAALAGRGRVLLRPSGTEPVVRVMVEGPDPAEVEALARQVAEVVARAASA